MYMCGFGLHKLLRSDNAIARRLTDALGRAIAKTLNAEEVNKSLKSNVNLVLN